jgi:hypothetical protein
MESRSAELVSQILASIRIVSLCRIAARGICSPFLCSARPVLLPLHCSLSMAPSFFASVSRVYSGGDCSGSGSGRLTLHSCSF